MLLLEALTPQHSLTELSLVVPRNWRTPLLLPSTLRALSLALSRRSQHYWPCWIFRVWKHRRYSQCRLSSSRLSLLSHLS